MLSSILLTKLAQDAGFDVELGGEDGWLKFGIPGGKLVAWLRAQSTGAVIALSRSDVLREITPTERWHGDKPPSAAGAFVLPTENEVLTYLTRARTLDRTLPNALLEEYEKAIARVDRTEAEALVRQRRGQDLFRRGLIEYWQCRCAVTGLAVLELLRASHAKPWKDCTDAERLDVHNGLLLAVHLDAAFDQGLITVGERGEIIASPMLNKEVRQLLGLSEGRAVHGLKPAHERYLAWHRLHVFRK
jgi:hypothetical protein